jgi:hypothetical protein
MGQLTAEKAKDRFLKLKMEVVTVRTKWMASGQGEGSIRHASDKTDDNSDMECDRAKPMSSTVIVHVFYIFGSVQTSTISSMLSVNSYLKSVHLTHPQKVK